MKATRNLENSAVLSELCHTVFEHALEANMILDADNTIIEANPAACQLLGYPREELLGMHIHQVQDEASIDAFSRQLVRAKATGQTTYVACHIHRDGTPMPVDIQLRHLDHKGRQITVKTSRPTTLQQQRNIEYEKIIQATGEGYWMVDASNARIIDVNDTFCQMVGYSREELLTMRIPDLEAVESAEETAAHIRKIMETGHDIFETRHRHKEGHIVEFEISVSYADIHGGVFFVFTRDISERKRQQEMMMLSSLVVNTSSATVMVTDAENRIVSVNPAFTKITGYLPEEVIGQNPSILSSGKQSKEFYHEMWEALLQTGHWQGEWWNKRKDGEEYAEQVNMNLLRRSDGSIYRHVKISTDITEKRRQDDKVWYHANYDSVTALPNRRLFLDRLGYELKKCERSGISLAVLYIDLDYFKDINDTHGHDAGDLLLIEASRRISNCIRNTDTVARLGGDEFAVLLIDLADTSRVDAVAKHINDTLSQPFHLHDIEATVSASIGIATNTGDSDTMKDIIRRADLAMYKAKRGGRNRYTYWAAETR
jgi:diguanylate cyclase (GGDEF)-like protein/PAS domain S-box-containing protein